MRPDAPAPTGPALSCILLVKAIDPAPGKLLDRLGGAIRDWNREATPKNGRFYAPATENPYRGGQSLGAEDFDAVVELRTDPEGWRRDGHGFLRRIADAWSGQIDVRRTVAVVGRRHVLKAGGARFELFVAARGNPDLPPDEIFDAWRQLGAYNARHHPSCSGYAQIHADLEATAAANDRLGLKSPRHIAIADECFADAKAIHDGLAYARTAVLTLEGRDPAPANFLGLLNRYLDFATASSLLATADQED